MIEGRIVEDGCSMILRVGVVMDDGQSIMRLSETFCFLACMNNLTTENANCSRCEI